MSRPRDTYRSATFLAEQNGVEPATIRKWARAWGVRTKQFGRKTVYNVRELDEAARRAADAAQPARARKRQKTERRVRVPQTVGELDALMKSLGADPLAPNTNGGAAERL